MMVKMFREQKGYRCRCLPMFWIHRCYRYTCLPMFVVHRCLWSYAEKMLMHKVWMTEIPRFRQEIPRFQSAQKPQSLNMRISSGQTYRPYICADTDAFRCFGPQMFTNTDGYRCFGLSDTFRCNTNRWSRLTDTSDTYGQNIYTLCETLFYWLYTLFDISLESRIVRPKFHNTSSRIPSKQETGFDSSSDLILQCHSHMCFSSGCGAPCGQHIGAAYACCWLWPCMI